MSTKTQLDEAALRYHSEGRPGKIGIVPTKPYHTQYDLSLAYSPGVAAPSLAIADNPDDVYKYTGKGNLVAVISNGTAVLGLGNIGPLAAKPVMEGKSMLFKTYAGIDAFDIEVDTTDPEEFIRTVKAIAPTFGGINLEDIKAPECFEIERRLRDELDIPLMHDDQHGTAIISSAALLNGAKDWSQYSWGGCSLIYDPDIASRLCCPSELKKTRNGERRPNSREEWLDVQARALYQAANRVYRYLKMLDRG